MTDMAPPNRPQSHDAALGRDPVCVERWPECNTGEYDPRCCRFPKSCSCTVYERPDPPAASGYLFPYLIDSPEDGGIEERGWLAGDLADTPRGAAKKMHVLYVADCGRDTLRYDERMTFACERQEWHKPTVMELDDEDGEQTRLALADDDPEEIRFNKCDPDDEGAQQWWVCELVPRRWQWRFWPFDLMRAAIDGYRHWRITPRLVALNQAVWAGGEDDPVLRDRLVRRSRRLYRLKDRLP